MLVLKTGFYVVSPFLTVMEVLPDGGFDWHGADKLDKATRFNTCFEAVTQLDVYLKQSPDGRNYAGILKLDEPING